MGDAFCNGRPLPARQSAWLLEHPDLLQGTALFESCRVVSGRIPLLPWHVRRLRAGLKALGLGALPHQAEWSAHLAAFLRANARKLEACKILALRNARGHLDVLLIPLAFVPLENTAYTDGVTLGISRQRRHSLDMSYSFKSASRLWCHVTRSETPPDADALVLNERDEICEGTIFNVIADRKSVV